MPLDDQPQASRSWTKQRNVNHGRDQNINTGSGSMTIGGETINVRGNFVWNSSEKSQAFTLWDAIAGVKASHDSDLQVERGECHPGTRELVIELIHQWRHLESRELPICWLSGPTGVGKSSIALTVARECDQDGLVSSFFFFRLDPRRNNPSFLALIIAHGLLVNIPELRQPVTQRIIANPKILEATFEDQARHLILQPLLKQKTWWNRTRRLWADFPRMSTRRPNLVIIDGLDECGGSDAQRRVLLLLLSICQASEPSPLRFLVCSRPEAWIRELFNSEPFLRLTKRIVLDDSFSPDADIRKYLDDSFRDIRREYSDITFPEPWPSEAHVKRIVRQSCGQFIYSVTIVKFVRTEFTDPVEQLDIILSSNPPTRPSPSPFHELDKLYHIVLSANPRWDRVLPILAAVLLLPSTCRYPKFIESILDLPSGRVALMLRAMHSVLEIKGGEDEIRVFHTSFMEYVCDPTRSERFFIDTVGLHDFLARGWLRALAIRVIENPRIILNPDSRSPLVHDMVVGWKSFCLRENQLHTELLLSELDGLYRAIISAFPVQNRFSKILAGLVVLPFKPNPATFRYKTSHFGFPSAALLSNFLTLQSCGLAFLQLESSAFHHDALNVKLEPTFVDFLYDASRSGEHYLHIPTQHDIFARQWLRAIIENGSSGTTGNSLIYPSPNFWEWMDFCCRIEQPSEELLSDLRSVSLGTIIASSVLSTPFPTSYGWWTTVFNGLDRMLSWLTSRTKSVPTELIGHFKNMGKLFDVSFPADMNPQVVDDFAVWMALVVTGCNGVSSVTRRLDVRLQEYQSVLGITVQDMTEGVDLEPTPVDPVSTTLVPATLIPGSSGVYRVSIQAACIRIVEDLVNDLQSLGNDNQHDKEIVSTLLCSTVLEHCGEHAGVLPLLKTVLSVAKTLDWSWCSGEAGLGFRARRHQVPINSGPHNKSMFRHIQVLASLERIKQRDLKEPSTLRAYGPPYATVERRDKILSWLKVIPLSVFSALLLEADRPVCVVLPVGAFASDCCA
ncbi:hypothetical protein V5O48_011863 [Marasmius crinis-equi]|uniref:Nephrocystin 3-like N-terminal domain-containing protein n=1 Tax=Marasmius crinis-equi TaxID=585013 RepID=A0ABR3F4C4_9AGAR